MTRLALTENRLPDVSFDRHSDPAKGNPNGYRFGRRSDKWVRAYVGEIVYRVEVDTLHRDHADT